MWERPRLTKKYAPQTYGPGPLGPLSLCLHRTIQGPIVEGSLPQQLGQLRDIRRDPPRLGRAFSNLDVAAWPLRSFYAAASFIIVVKIGIRIYKRPHPDAVIGLVSHSPDICDTAFIKGFGIAIRAIVFVVNAMLFRSPVAGFVS